MMDVVDQSRCAADARYQRALRQFASVLVGDFVYFVRAFQMMGLVDRMRVLDVCRRDATKSYCGRRGAFGS